MRPRRIRAQHLQSRLQSTSSSTTPCPPPRLTCPCPAAQLSCHVWPPTVVAISELRRWRSNLTTKPPFLYRHLSHQTWPYPEMWMRPGPKMSKPQGIREGLLATGSRVPDSHRLCSHLTLPSHTHSSTAGWALVSARERGPHGHGASQSELTRSEAAVNSSHTGRKFPSHDHHFKGVFCRWVLWSLGHQAGEGPACPRHPQKSASHGSSPCP